MGEVDQVPLISTLIAWAFMLWIALAVAWKIGSVLSGWIAPVETEKPATARRASTPPAKVPAPKPAPAPPINQPVEPISAPAPPITMAEIREDLSQSWQREFDELLRECGQRSNGGGPAGV